MIKSMTGFGKAVAETTKRKIYAEVKSLNSKQFDLTLKVPWLYKEKEAEIRNLINKKLDRGKIDFNIYFDVLEEESSSIINQDVVKNYYRQLQTIANDLNMTLDNTVLGTIMRLPDALKNEREELDEDEWDALKNIIDEALSQIDTYRIDEGKAIEADFKKAIARILDMLAQVEKLDGERIVKVRQRLNSSLSEFIDNGTLDKNRLEQEIIYYIEKLDINEEKVRLRKHCEYFLDKMEDSTSNGKVLNFISQEMGREINTMGSKANDADIQRLVVGMKDELEKIKEQTLNVL
ncbi:MAG: YicC family protein [Bacteroidales bacterium]|nr:YicC family protein [Bacteroidales bacterium]